MVISRDLFKLVHLNPIRTPERHLVVATEAHTVGGTHPTGMLSFSFIVSNLRCRETLVGWQCFCDVNGQVVPVNGTECLSEYSSVADLGEELKSNISVSSFEPPFKPSGHLIL